MFVYMCVCVCVRAQLWKAWSDFNQTWYTHCYILKLVVCILLRVLGQVQGFRLTQHWFEYFI
jgi:hypothetical protein